MCVVGREEVRRVFVVLFKALTCTVAGKELAASVDLRRKERILTRILILHPDTASTNDEDWGKGERGGSEKRGGGKRENRGGRRYIRGVEQLDCLALQSHLQPATTAVVCRGLPWCPDRG